MDINDIELRLIKLHDRMHQSYKNANSDFFPSIGLKWALKDAGAEIRSILAEIRAQERASKKEASNEPTV